MTSRKLLWLALGITALPLVLEAMSGCSFNAAGAQRNDNAYMCECSCSGDARDIMLVIGASADDADETLAGTVAIDDDDLDLGEKIVGVRFANAMIPPGATIESAFVQFTANERGTGSFSFEITAEESPDAAMFEATAGNISGRTVIPLSVQWDDAADWILGEDGAAQRTPDLTPLLQALVDQGVWSNASPIVLRFQGTGHREASSFDDGAPRAPQLVVTFNPSIAARLPICAPKDVERDDHGNILEADLEEDCEGAEARVEKTLEGLAGACGYPTACSCAVVAYEEEMGEDVFSFDTSVCGDGSCEEVEVDASCSNFNPNGFADCVGTNCEAFVSATNADDDKPVCVASGGSLAFQLFGLRSTCEITEGVTEIEVGDREPKKDPKTRGTVEFLGGPCPAESCSVSTFLRLAMAPITFDIKWHSDPTFSDLNASGHSLPGAALLDAAGGGEFPVESLDGTGSGRRGSTALSVDATNEEPLGVVVDWSARRCDLDGNVASVVDGEQGVCAGDGATECNEDSPDCDEVGGPCEFEVEDTEEMVMNLDVAGDLVNQPPRSAAGADQTVECTSTAGASFALDGTGSTDPDANLAIWSWRSGSRIGPEVGIVPVVTDALGVGETRGYVLRVIDTFAQADEDTTSVAVLDTTPPEVTCNAVATITPPDAPISFTATATDTCDAAVTPEVLGFDCFTFTKKGRRIDKRESCEVSFLGDTLAIVDAGGVGDHIAWTVRGTDDSGNASTVECGLTVVKPSR